MPSPFTPTITVRLARCVARLARDRRANTLAMIAAALVPILGMVGGGIDMGRSYLVQTRLQQACDAGVLAARKKLGSQATNGGSVPAAVATVGNAFFNINFRSGAYGTLGHEFTMTVASDQAINGTARTVTPTTIMRLFGYTEMPIQVACSARLNFSNTDVMMVLDTTGSMNEVNPGDAKSRIDELRDVVKAFHAQLEASKAPGTRIRYGFVPYSTNVNVGGLLKPDWVVDTWTYQGRVQHDTGLTTFGTQITENWTYVSGTQQLGATTVRSSCPSNAVSSTVVRSWTSSNGTQNVEYLVTGTGYTCQFVEPGTIRVTPTTYDRYDYIYSSLNQGYKKIPVYDWRYQQVTLSVASLKDGTGGKLRVGGAITVPKMGGTAQRPSDATAWFRGCMEERATYNIGDYGSVDLSRARDLDIDAVPVAGNPDTQWRPMLHEVSYERTIDQYGRGNFSPSPVSTGSILLNAWSAGTSACPAAASKLAEMDSGQVATYVASLFAEGSTYHDIGMIWGGRLLSPGGLFADENQDRPGQPTSRHLIFLTDGVTAPLEYSYGAYGIEPLDLRRWSQSSALSLTQVVESRFTVACDEVKKRNITVWVIGFGTQLNPALTRCAGAGHSFEAGNAAQLSAIFSTIAAEMGDLRVSN